MSYTINSAKEQAATYQPLLLAEITFADASVLRLCTHDLRTATTGLQYQSHDWLPRIQNQQLAATQALSSDGIDGVPTVTLKLADADRALWNGYELANGIKGSRLDLIFVFLDLATNTFSTDERIIFSGLCDAPNMDEETMSITATSLMSMLRINLPPYRIQRQHMFPFPSTADERYSALHDPDSQFYRTGYSPDIAGGMGNFQSDGTTPYTAADFNGTFEDYIKTMGKGPESSQATATATVSAGRITAITVTSGGSGYTSTATVTIHGVGSGAGAVATMSGGSVASISLTGQGWNYTTVPIITISNAVGDLTKDHSNRPTGTFSGIRYVPATTYKSKDYLAGKTIVGTNADVSTTLYQSYVPMVYGTASVNPVVINVLGDGNSTRAECLLCLGQITGILNNSVTVNDIELLASSDIDHNAYNVADKLLRFDYVSNGSRFGRVNADALYDSKGDCYGSMAVIEVVVVKSIAPSSSAPSVRAVVQGPKIHQFVGVDHITVTSGVAVVTLTGTNVNFASNDATFLLTISGNSNPDLNTGWLGLTGWTAGPPGTATFNSPGIADGTYTGGTIGYLAYSDNPVWIMLEILTSWCSWTFADVNIQSFIDSAGIAARSVQFIDADGTADTHALFKTSLVIQQRKSAAELIRGLRNSFRGMLSHNPATGLLETFIKQTLADQQPSTIAGSNYNTAVPSIDHDGAPVNGYVAYRFAEDNGTILRRNGKSTLTITQTGITNSPNSLSVSFQDANNSYQVDNVTIVDSADIGRSNQVVTNQFNCEGLSSYDQAQRVCACQLAETLKMNPRNDTGGSMQFQWETSAKGINLRVGQIVMLDTAHNALEDILVRLTKVQPASNFETVKLEGTYHLDFAYTDLYGTTGFIAHSRPPRGRLNRPPYRWLPYEVAPTNTADAWYSTSNYTFQVAQEFTTDAGGLTPIVNLLVTGKQPINTFSNSITPVTVRPSYSTSSSGGTLLGNRVYSLAVIAKDSAGLYTPITKDGQIINIPVAAGTSTNTVTLTDILWTDGTVGYAVFAGLSPNTLCWQSDNTGTPATITLSSMFDQTWGLPDVEFDKLRAKIKIIEHAGVLGLAVNGTVTATTLQVVDQTWTTDQWAGRVVSIIGDADDSNILKVLNFTIVSNTADTLTIIGDLVSENVADDDAIVIRTLADTFSSTTIGDSQVVNSVYPTGYVVNGEKGRKVRIIHGMGEGQSAMIQSNTSTVLTIDGSWTVTPDATSVYIVEEASWLGSPTDTSSITNSDSSSEITIRVPIDNYLNQTLLVEASTVDGNGLESFNNLFREVWMFGQTGTSGASSIQIAIPTS
jgi:hypothetical protein